MYEFKMHLYFIHTTKYIIQKELSRLLFFVIQSYTYLVRRNYINMKLLLGKLVAQKILDRLKSDISLAVSKPGLAVVLVGDDKASEIYVGLKRKKAEEIGMNFFLYNFDKTASQEEILERITSLNKDEKVHGIIVQLPLPEKFNTEKIIASIEPKKDADGFSSQGKVVPGENFALVPVFPQAIIKLIESSNEEIFGKKAVVVANSELFGQTMCAMLEHEGVLSEYVLTGDILLKLGEIKSADIVVSAVGSPGLLEGNMFKEGAIVIDGGITKIGDQVVGDVSFGSTKRLNGFISPVPGGVGPVTITCLLENTYLAFEAQQKEK